MPATADAGRIARIAFTADGTFSIGLDGRNDLVTGHWRQDAPEAFVLAPDRPAWAALRPAMVVVRRTSEKIVIRTSIG